jgi:hypothetical protein
VPKAYLTNAKPAQIGLWQVIAIALLLPSVPQWAEKSLGAELPVVARIKILHNKITAQEASPII